MGVGDGGGSGVGREDTTLAPGRAQEKTPKLRLNKLILIIWLIIVLKKGGVRRRKKKKSFYIWAKTAHYGSQELSLYIEGKYF